MVEFGILATELAFSLSFAVVACGGGTAPQRPPSIVTYALVTIDGKALPLPEEAGSPNIIENGRVELIGDDSARVIQTVGEPDSITVFQVGDYHVERNGSTLIFHPYYLAARIDTASLVGSELMLRAHIVTAAGVLVESRIYTEQ